MKVLTLIDALHHPGVGVGRGEERVALREDRFESREIHLDLGVTQVAEGLEGGPVGRRKAGEPGSIVEMTRQREQRAQIAGQGRPQG